MNREIKFRAWDGKEMHIPSSYDKYANVNFWSFKQIAKTGLEMAGITIMQYTGRMDKKGIEIYEDDWCRAEFRTKEGIQVIQGRIIMDEYMWCIDCTGSIGDDIFSINRAHNFEVIGNIYQNPELLNQ